MFDMDREHKVFSSSERFHIVKIPSAVRIFGNYSSPKP